MGLAFFYLGYNHEQKKMEQQSPQYPEIWDEASRRSKRAISILI